MDIWDIEKAKQLYGIPKWGKGYFDVNNNGNVIICPEGKEKPHVDLLELTEDLKERGIRCPMLIRFPNITNERIKLLNNCFAKAIKEYDYKGKYQGVYPIKVNQQRHLVEEIVIGAFTTVKITIATEVPAIVQHVAKTHTDIAFVTVIVIHTAA